MMLSICCLARMQRARRFACTSFLYVCMCVSIYKCRASRISVSIRTYKRDVAIHKINNIYYRPIFGQYIIYAVLPGDLIFELHFHANA